MIEQGIDPDDIDYSGTEIEITVSDRDTLAIMSCAAFSLSSIPSCFIK